MSDNTQLVSRLIEILVQYVPALRTQAESFSDDYFAQRALLRGLMNMHNVQNPLSDEYFKLQDTLLKNELAEKKLVTLDSFKKSKINPKMSLWQGDITCVKADAIINAANSSLLGCFQAGHNCIDNCIHSAAGLQLRFECSKIIKGGSAKVGSATITHAFNLPCKYVIHVVGPQVGFEVSEQNRADLASCYTQALKVARKNGVKSIVFSCVSTGVFGFPSAKAASIAVDTVKEDLEANGQDIDVGFDVFLERDYKVYDALLNPSDEKKDAELHPYFNLNLI